MSTTPAPAPTGNGAAATQTPAAPAAPKKDTATGPQTPATGEQPRRPDGKYDTKPKDAAAPPPVDEDPEIDLGGVKMRRRAALSEIERGRQASKLLAQAQKAQAEAQRLNSARDSAIAKAKAAGDIGEVIRLLDLPPDQERALITKYVHSKFVEPQQLTEEQRRLRELEAERDKLKADADARAKAETDAKRKAEIAEAGKGLESELLEAAKAGKIPGAGEPGSPAAVAALKRVAAKLDFYAEKGLDISVDQAVGLVRQDIAQDMAPYIMSSDIGELREVMGPAAFRAHMERMLDYAQSLVRPKQEAPKPRQPAAPPAESKKTLTPQEFLEEMRRRK